MGWTIKQSRLRDNIIGKAQKGRWTAEVAEQEAGRLGVGPLASKPDFADYDPLQETYWSILMTLAWIMWRDADHVREFWDDWRTQCKEWRSFEAKMPDGRDVSGWRLESRKSASLSLLYVEEARERAHGNPPLIAEFDAEQELWRHLQIGVLTAFGRGPSIIRLKRNKIPIPAESWQDLKLKNEEDRVLFMSSKVLEHWEDVAFPRHDVLRLWPGAAPFSSKSSDNNTKRQPPTSPKNKERQRSPEENARLKVKYESVLAAGRSLRNRHPRLGPDELAALMDKEKRQGLSTETVRKILSGRYKVLKRFGLNGIF